MLIKLDFIGVIIAYQPLIQYLIVMVMEIHIIED
jgi:hypothetical protein